MKKFKNNLDSESRIEAEDLLKDRSEEERAGLRELYRLNERKKSMRRSIAIFVFAILFCVIPAVMPYDSMGLKAPAPMVIAVLCLFAALVIAVISIVAFVRSMSRVEGLSDEEKELRGALIYADIMNEQMAAMAEALSYSQGFEPVSEFIERHRAEKVDDIPPLDEADCEEREADDIPELDDDGCEVVEASEPCDIDECED